MKRLVCVNPSARANALRISRSVSGPKVVNETRPPTLRKREVAPHEIERHAAQRQRVDVAAYAVGRCRSARDGGQQPAQNRAPLARPRARHLDHWQRVVEGDDAGGGIADAELADRLARAAAGIEDERGRELHVIEPLRHAHADLALQRGRRVVRRRRARERTPHRARVDVARIRRGKARRAHRGRREPWQGRRRDATGTARAPRPRSTRSVRRESRSQATRLRRRAPAHRAIP
jgi:hypothetical protein